jgi:hypothetical protein
MAGFRPNKLKAIAGISPHSMRRYSVKQLPKNRRRSHGWAAILAKVVTSQTAVGSTVVLR